MHQAGKMPCLLLGDPGKRHGMFLCFNVELLGPSIMGMMRANVILDNFNLFSSLDYNCT